MSNVDGARQWPNTTVYKGNNEDGLPIIVGNSATFHAHAMELLDMHEWVIVVGPGDPWYEEPK